MWTLCHGFYFLTTCRCQTKMMLRLVVFVKMFLRMETMGNTHHPLPLNKMHSSVFSQIVLKSKCLSSTDWTYLFVEIRYARALHLMLCRLQRCYSEPAGCLKSMFYLSFLGFSCWPSSIQYSQILSVLSVSLCSSSIVKDATIFQMKRKTIILIFKASGSYADNNK